MKKIQEDLQLKTTNGISELVGLVDLGNDKELMDGINTGIYSSYNILYIVLLIFFTNLSRYKQVVPDSKNFLISHLSKF